jgi:hypothetical protein
LSRQNDYSECPLDRTKYKLENNSPESIMNIIALNEIAFKSLDPNEIVKCKICGELNLPCDGIQRKNYKDHWFDIHYKNDTHLISLLQKSDHIQEQDYNYILLPPELTTPEEIERQRWIERCIREETNAIRAIHSYIHSSDKRIFFAKLKKIWTNCKNMRSMTNINLSLNEWKTKYDVIKNEADECMKEIFKYQQPSHLQNIYTNHPHHRGDIMDYLKFIEIEKDKYEIKKQQKKERSEKHKNLVMIHKLQKNIDQPSKHKIKRNRRQENKIKKNNNQPLNESTSIQTSTGSLTVPVVKGGIGSTSGN